MWRCLVERNVRAGQVSNVVILAVGIVKDQW